jgi:hypothetical protein
VEFQVAKLHLIGTWRRLITMLSLGSSVSPYWLFADYKAQQHVRSCNE